MTQFLIIFLILIILLSILICILTCCVRCFFGTKLVSMPEDDIV